MKEWLLQYMTPQLAQLLEAFADPEVSITDERLVELHAFCTDEGGYGYLQMLAEEVRQTNQHLPKNLSIFVNIHAEGEPGGFVIDFLYDNVPFFFTPISEVRSWIDKDVLEVPVTRQYVVETLLKLTDDALQIRYRGVTDLLVNLVHRIGVTLDIGIICEIMQEDGNVPVITVNTKNHTFLLNVADFYHPEDPVKRVLRILAYFQPMLQPAA